MNVHLLAELHRAQHRGQRTLEVSVTELRELLAQLEAQEAQALPGKPVGWASGEKIEAMRRLSRKYLTVSQYKTEKFDTRVCI